VTSIDFYYSIGSRYSYLAATQIAALERDTGCRLEWHPLDSRALISRRSHDPFDGPPVSGQYDWAYRELDAKRWAAFYGVPFIEPRGRVSFDSEVLALAAVAAKRLGHVQDYSRELFAAMFAEPTVTRIDGAECIRRAQRCSMAESQFQTELDNPATADELSETLDTVHRLGIFGVPTFVAGTELFWGNDRLVLLRHHLLQRTPEWSVP
jgi:2-hydroxychromene-2-carboxylate isomerase